MGSKPITIDDYLATVPPDRRAALEQLRRTMHELMPGLEECISYAMPAFRRGHDVVGGFLATQAGCSYYPFSGTTLGTLADDLRAYSQTKAALHFSPDHPLPKSLVKKLLRTRQAEVDAKLAAKSAQTPKSARAKTTQTHASGTKKKKSVSAKAR